MKNFTLSLFMMILTMCGAYAQLAQETFETWPVNNSGGPTTWKTYNDVSTAPQSTVTWAQSSGSGQFVGYQSTYAAIANREQLPSPPNTFPVDWLMTPQFQVPQNPVLRFYTKLIQGGDQGNKFDIRISENADQMALGNYVSIIDGSQGQFPIGENDLMENGDHFTYISKVYSIPVSYVGKQVYIAFVMRGLTNQGDRWFVDNVSVEKRCDKPTVANPVYTNPTTSGATLHWVNPSGATSQEIEVVPATSSPNGSGYVVNATTSIAWPAGGAPNLAPDTDYKFYIRSICSSSNPSEWAGPFNFSTVPLGARCGEPLTINTLPFQTTNNTGNFGDFVEGNPGSSCGGGSSALNGNEVIYAYTATFTGLININMTNNGTNAGMFVYADCNSIGQSCLAGGVGSGIPVNLNNFSVTNGQTYYIVISTAGSTQTTPYTLTVQAASCTPPTSTPPTAANIGPHSATLSWNPVATGIVKWRIVVQPQGSGIPQGLGEETTNNTAYLADNLLEATPYEYWIRNDCNNGTYSAWAGPYLFSTVQVPAVISYTQNFPTAAAGFTLVNGAEPNKWAVGSAATNGSATALYISNDNGVTNAYTGDPLPVVPPTDPTPVTSIVHAYTNINMPNPVTDMSVLFDWKNLGDANDYFTVWLVPATFAPQAGQAITAVPNERIKLGGDNFNSTTWTAAQLNQEVTQFAGQAMRVVIEWRNDNAGEFNPPAAIDNFRIKLSYALGYSQGFENNPTGFTLVNGTGTTQPNKWVVGEATHNGGTRSLYVSSDEGATNSYVNTTSTVHAYRDVAIPAGAYEITISFDWKSVGDNADYFNVWMVPDSFTPTAGQLISAAANQRIKVGTTDIYGGTGWQNAQYTINVAQFAGTTRRLVFTWRNNATTLTPPPAAIDNLNIKLVTCSQPTNLQVANATQTGAYYSWAGPPSGAVSYDYYFSTSDTPPTDTTAISGNTTDPFVTPTTMLDNTTYYFWVRTVCSDANGKSFWTGPVQVLTPQIPATLTYNQDFEAATSGFTFISGSYANKWVVGSETNNGGTKSLYISNNTANAYQYTNTVNTPAVFAYRDFTVPATVPANNQIEVSFDWKAAGDANDYLKVWIVPTSYNPVAGTAITAAADRQQVGGNFNLNGTWTSVSYDISIAGYLGLNRRIVFEWRNNASGGDQPPAAIDNLKIRVLTCPSPATVTVGAITANSAVLSWTPTVPTPAQYDYYVSTNISNVPADTTTPTGFVTLPTVTLDDELAGSTNFYFWVRSNCGTGDLGRWTGPIQFGLPQVSAPLNYIDNMEGNIGWTVVNGTQANKWVVGSAVSSSASTSLYVSNNNGQGNNYTIGTASTVHAYRDIQMPTTPADISVSFQWKGGGEGTTDRLRVWVVPDNFVPVAGTQITANATRQLVGTFSESNGVWKNESFVVPSMAYAGTTRRVVFEWVNNASGGSQPAMAVDNFNFRIVTCPAVINPTVTGGAIIGDVFLSWTPVGTETEWELVIQLQDTGLPGMNPATVITVTGNPNYTFNTPAGIFYEYYVRPVCADDDKGLWAGPVPFSVFAPPACAKVDLFDEDLEVIEPGTNISICPGENACVELTADYLETGSTASYAVEPIEYAPQFPFTGGIEMNITQDDRWAPPFTLPADFKFCFYGTKQTKVQVGSNGVVTFGTNFSTTDTCQWDLNGLQIPNTAFPIKNAIYGVYQDIYPPEHNEFANPSINYQILGTYPCRAFVVNYSEIAQFGPGYCDDEPAIGPQTSQIVFYEISNIVEVYVKRRVPCTQWPSGAGEGGQGVIGVQNAAGTAAVAAPGRNTGPWTAIEEAYRFTPNGPSNVQFAWYQGTNLYSTDETIQVCVTDTTPINLIARATYTGCGTDVTVVETPITIVPEQPIIITQTNNLIECPTSGTTATFNLPDGIAGGLVNPSLYTVTFYDTEAKANDGVAGTELPASYTTGTATIWVRVQLTGRACFAVNSFTVTVKQAPTFDLPADFAICQGQTGTIAISNANFDLAGANVTYVWSDGTTTLADTDSSIDVTATGTYSVKVNWDGCELTKSVNVTVNPLPTPDDPADVTVCTSYTLPALSAGNNYYTAANGPAGTGTMLNAGDVITQTTTLYVYVQGATPDCFADNSFIVNIENAPVLTAPANVNTCQSYTLPALAVGNYYDAPGGTGNMIPANTAITTNQTIYIYAVAGTQSCASEVSFTVNITPDVTADVIGNQIVCESFTLQPLSQYNAYYTGPGGTGQQLAVNSVLTANQTIYVYAVNGTCTDESSFTLTVVPKPLPVAIDGGCQGGQFVLTAVFDPSEPNYNAGNVSFAWTRSEGGDVIGIEQSIVAAESGDYYLTITPTGSSVTGCSVTAFADVDDNTCMIQRGISPNNDGKNDNFDLTAYDVTRISIFNRYGKEVYSYGAYTDQWHGQSKDGDELPTGTYFYSYKRANGEDVTGWIYINREEN